MKSIIKFLLILLATSTLTHAKALLECMSDEDPERKYIREALLPHIEKVSKDRYVGSKEFSMRLNEEDIRTRLLQIASRYAGADHEKDRRALQMATEAMRFLRLLWGDDIVETLAPYLKSPSFPARRSAITAIARNPKSVPYLIEALHDCEARWDSGDEDPADAMNSYWRAIVEALAGHGTSESLAAIDGFSKRIEKDYGGSVQGDRLLSSVRHYKERGIQKKQELQGRRKKAAEEAASAGSSVEVPKTPSTTSPNNPAAANPTPQESNPTP